MIGPDATAMKDSAHLKRWLRETGRNYIILKTDDLVDALAWPTGVETLIQVVDAYRQQRQTQVIETRPCPGAHKHRTGLVCTLCRDTGVVPIKVKGELLELEEIDEAIAQLQLLYIDLETRRSELARNAPRTAR